VPRHARRTAPRRNAAAALLAAAIGVPLAAGSLAHAVVQTPDASAAREATAADVALDAVRAQRGAERAAAQAARVAAEQAAAEAARVAAEGQARAAALAAERAAAADRAARAARSADPRSVARRLLAERGQGDQFGCLDRLWHKESGWRWNADNPTSSAYGIPQSLPGSKMASAGADWRTNPGTQIRWGLGYISEVYGGPCAAWRHSQAVDWY
jgi:hypothetical protein